jgi:CheY-like chemotaxis protein
MFNTSEVVRPASATAFRSQRVDYLPPGAERLARALRVLVVDDIAMNRDIAAAFIRAGGHVVTCVASGSDAVRAAAETDFDVVMMDVMMPRMDGLAATQRIRALPGPRGRVPIVAMTLQSRDAQVETCLWNGMDGHVGKPFTPQALLRALERGDAVGQADRQP